MEHDSAVINAPVVAATLAAAVFSRLELPADADPSQEILRIYRRTLQRLVAMKPVDTKTLTRSAATK